MKVYIVLQWKVDRWSKLINKKIIKWCGLKDAVASWERRKDFKVSLYDTWYRTKDSIVCDDKRNATGLVCSSLTRFECFIACDCVMNSLDLATSLLRRFCSRPIFRASQMRKTPSRGPIFRSPRMGTLATQAISHSLKKSGKILEIYIWLLSGILCCVLGQDTLQCLSLSVPLSTQMYKRVPAICWGNLIK